MQRLDQPELLDGAVSQIDLAANLSDIARLNRLTGTRVALCQAVLSLLDLSPTFKYQTQRAKSTKVDASRFQSTLVNFIGSAWDSSPRLSCTILDIGTGAADFPEMLRRRTQQHDLTINIIAADLHSGVLHYVRQTNPNLSTIQLDGTHLPIAAQSVDVITCAQTIHHLNPDQIVCLLTECARICRIGFVLLDLERSPGAVLAIKLLTTLISTNRLTRHDGPLSARRAYRGAEIATFGAQAGLSLNIRPLFPFRWVATWRRTT